MWKRHVKMKNPLIESFENWNPPYFWLRRKGTSTFPLADFCHRQEYAWLKHFIAFLVLGNNTSPSNKKSLDPFKIRRKWEFFKLNGRKLVKALLFVQNVFHHKCSLQVLPRSFNIRNEYSPLFILSIVVVMSSLSDLSTKISNQWKQSRSHTTLFSRWHTVLSDRFGLLDTAANRCT